MGQNEIENLRKSYWNKAFELLTKLNVLGSEEFIRQELIYKDNPIGFTISNIHRLMDKDNSTGGNEHSLRAVEWIDNTLLLDCTSEQKAELYHLRAFAFSYNIKDYQQALLSINKSLEFSTQGTQLLDNRYNDLLTLKGEILTQLDKYDECLTLYSESYELCLKYESLKINAAPYTLENKARVLLIMNKKEEALYEINKCFTLFPKGSPHYYNQYNALNTRADIKRSMGDLDGSKKDEALADEWRDKYDQILFELNEKRKS